MTGAKNSVLKLMAAALLAEGRTTLTRGAATSSTSRSWPSCCAGWAATVDYDAEAATVAIDVPAELGHQADYDLVRRMRASICVLGPLIARCGRAEVALPGGDAIGSAAAGHAHRRAGASSAPSFDSEHGYLIAKAPQGLTGARSGWTSRASAPPRTS